MMQSSFVIISNRYRHNSVCVILFRRKTVSSIFLYLLLAPCLRRTRRRPITIRRKLSPADRKSRERSSRARNTRPILRQTIYFLRVIRWILAEAVASFFHHAARPRRRGSFRRGSGSAGRRASSISNLLIIRDVGGPWFARFFYDDFSVSRRIIVSPFLLCVEVATVFATANFDLGCTRGTVYHSGEWRMLTRAKRVCLVLTWRVTFADDSPLRGDNGRARDSESFASKTTPMPVPIPSNAALWLLRSCAREEIATAMRHRDRHFLYGCRRPRSSSLRVSLIA